MVPRVLTSLVGIPVLISAIWWGAPWLALLVALAAALGVRELYRLAPVSSPYTPLLQKEANPPSAEGPPAGGPGPSAPSTVFRTGFGSRWGELPTTLGALWAIALVLGGQAASNTSSLLFISLGILLGGAFVAFLWLIAFYGPTPALSKGATAPFSGRGRKGFLVAGAYLIGGPIYIGFPLAHALALRDLEGASALGRDGLLFALLVTFATDTGAFFVGRGFGRHRMAPRISPNKTWEGAAGGFLLAVAVALALGQLLGPILPVWQQGVMGATVGVGAQLGDLFESRLKRLSQVKDAGGIIPGHGGILDRLDSIVVAVPVVYYLLALAFKP